MHEELEIKEVTPMSKMEDCIIWLNEEIKDAIVIHKGGKKNNAHGRLCA